MSRMIMRRQSSRRLSIGQRRKASLAALPLLEAAAQTLEDEEAKFSNATHVSFEKYYDDVCKKLVSDKWMIKFDQTVNDYYYEHQEEETTTWEKPEDVVWLRCFEENSANSYFFNLMTGEQRWTRPEVPEINKNELKAVEELKVTELTYLRKLRLLTRLFSEPMRHLQVTGTPLIDEASWRLIFGDTGSILALAEKFYEKLELRIPLAMDIDTRTFKLPNHFVLEAFRDLVKFFKLYSSYFKRYQEGTEAVMKIAAHNDEFVDFLIASQAKSKDVEKSWESLTHLEAMNADINDQSTMKRNRNSAEGCGRRSIRGIPTGSVRRLSKEVDLGGTGDPQSKPESTCSPAEALNFLQSLRILPVQRLPRYVLLLERLLQNDIDLSDTDSDKIEAMMKEVREVARDCDIIVNKDNGWRKLWQIQQSVKDLRHRIMSKNRNFVYDGELVAIGRDLPSSGVDAALGWWTGRKERTYHVFLCDDILLFCKPTHKEKGQQMYEKRGLLTIRRIVDCRREHDPSSWTIFRVYGTVIDLHPKLLWTQACGEGGSVHGDFRDEFDAEETARLKSDGDETHAIDVNTIVKANVAVQKANMQRLGSVTFRAKDAVEKMMWLQKFCPDFRPTQMGIQKEATAATLIDENSTIQEVCNSEHSEHSASPNNSIELLPPTSTLDIKEVTQLSDFGGDVEQFYEASVPKFHSPDYVSTVSAETSTWHSEEGHSVAGGVKSPTEGEPSMLFEGSMCGTQDDPAPLNQDAYMNHVDDTTTGTNSVETVVLPRRRLRLGPGSSPRRSSLGYRRQTR